MPKNQFRTIIQERKKREAKPAKVVSPEKLAAKAAGFAAFQARKAFRKAVRAAKSKGERMSSSPPR